MALPQPQVSVLFLRAHEDGIRAVAFSPVAETVATASDRGEVRLWEIGTRRVLSRFDPVGCPLYCLAFSPDGSTLAACGLSSNIWLWNVVTREQMRPLEHEGGCRRFRRRPA